MRRVNRRRRRRRGRCSFLENHITMEANCTNVIFYPAFAFTHIITMAVCVEPNEFKYTHTVRHRQASSGE